MPQSQGCIFLHNSFPKGGGIKDLIQGIKSKKREEGKEREKGRRKRKKSAQGREKGKGRKRKQEYKKERKIQKN